MDVYEIPLSSEPQSLVVSLSGTAYRLTLVWNPVSSAWVLDIADTSGNAILSGVPLVAGADLLAPVAYLGLGGALYVQTDNDAEAPPTVDNLGATAHVYWVPAA